MVLLFCSRSYHIHRDLLGWLLHKVIGELRNDTIHRGVPRVVQREPLVLGALKMLESGKSPFSNTHPFTEFVVTATSHSLEGTQTFHQIEPLFGSRFGKRRQRCYPQLLTASMLFP